MKLKRRGCFVGAVLLAGVLLGGALAAWRWCAAAKPKAPQLPKAEMFWTLRAVSAYLAMMEKPDAKRAYFDATAETYREFVSRAGVECRGMADAEGKFDLVLVRDADPGAEGWKALVDRLSTSGVLVWGFSVKDMRAEEFRRRLEAFPCVAAHLWMPGADEWLLAGRREERRLKLDEMLELFARESTFEDLACAGCGTLPEMFASYAGTREDVMPAFEGLSADAIVRPELFLTKGLPGAAWVTPGDIDEDIGRGIEEEVRSAQRVRREVVEGNMLSAAGKAQEAISLWARAFLRNPHDPLLLERLERLEVNAQTFLRVGNVQTATKCYETMALINPKNAATVRCLGQCYAMTGQKERAAELSRRADELCRQAGKRQGADGADGLDGR